LVSSAASAIGTGAGWDPAMAHTRTHDTCAEESVAMTVTAAAAAAGARHFRQKACLFCRQTSFETLKKRNPLKCPLEFRTL